MSIAALIHDVSSDKNSIHETLLKATKHILDNKKAKNLADIAKKLKISASLLSHYMNGDRQMSVDFIDKFNTNFELNLYNVQSFEVPLWIEDFMGNAEEGMYPDIAASLYLRTYAQLRNKNNVQRGVIARLHQLNEELNKKNQLLLNLVEKFEPIVLKSILENKLN